MFKINKKIFKKILLYTRANTEWMVCGLLYVKHINTLVHPRHHRSLKNRNLILKRLVLKSMLELQAAFRFQRSVVTNSLKWWFSYLSTSSSYSDVDGDHPKMRNWKAHYQPKILLLALKPYRPVWPVNFEHLLLKWNSCTF